VNDLSQMQDNNDDNLTIDAAKCPYEWPGQASHFCFMTHKSEVWVNT
jgi:hypothetical protein